MTVPLFHVDAFTDRPFAGNPAAVCMLPSWKEDRWLQAVAREMNLSETAFLVKQPGHFDVRWFTPTVEIDLCGHATLASAHVLFTHRGLKEASVRFQSQSGELRVDRENNQLVLDFPSRPLRQCDPPASIEKALGARPASVWKDRDYYAVFNSEADVAELKPDLQIFPEIDSQGVVVTAPGDTCDFVSRYFAPLAGIPEDPVTGSTHCSLIPFWSAKLGKQRLLARQLSSRGGELVCENRGERVGIGGTCLTYIEGKLHFD